MLKYHSLEGLPMFIWYPLMKVTGYFYFKHKSGIARKVWRAL